MICIKKWMNETESDEKPADNEGAAMVTPTMENTSKSREVDAPEDLERGTTTPVPSLSSSSTTLSHESAGSSNSTDQTIPQSGEKERKTETPIIDPLVHDTQLLTKSTVQQLQGSVNDILAQDEASPTRSTLQLLEGLLQTLYPLIANQSDVRLLDELESTLNIVGNDLSLLLAEHHTFDSIRELEIKDQIAFLLVLQTLEVEVLVFIESIETFIIKFGGSIIKNDIQSLKRSTNAKYCMLIKFELEKKDQSSSEASNSVENQFLNSNFDDESGTIDVSALLDKYSKAVLVHPESSKTTNTAEIPHSELEIFEILETGGFGVVKKARWKTQHKEVALKTLQGPVTPKVMAEFVAEMNRWKALRHENIVQLFGSSEDPNTRQPGFVMELMERSLSDYLYKSDYCDMDLSKVCKVGLEVAKGLAFLHDKMIIHRDIKPQNVLLRNGLEEIKLCDFGLSITKQESSTTTTTTGQQIGGTPAYMSPEVLDGKCSFKSDIFSFGIMLGEITEGKKPFDHCGTLQILQKISTGQRPGLDNSKEKYHPWLITFIERCWGGR